MWSPPSPWAGGYGAADSRADHQHQAVAEGADPHQEVGQRQPELKQADGPLVVVISVEQYWIFAVSLKKGRDTIKVSLFIAPYLTFRPYLLDLVQKDVKFWL